MMVSIMSHENVYLLIPLQGCDVDQAIYVYLKYSYCSHFTFIYYILIILLNCLHVSNIVTRTTNLYSVSDSDGDDVHCRWATNSRDECAGICNGFPDAYIDEVNSTQRVLYTDAVRVFRITTILQGSIIFSFQLKYVVIQNTQQTQP